MSESDDQTKTTNTNIIVRVTKNIENHIHNTKNKCNRLFLDFSSSIISFFSNNYLLNSPFIIVQKCNNKNSIKLDTLEVNHTERKALVIFLSISSLIITLYKSRSFIRFMRFIPYYLFFSLLFCRENLNPYSY